MKSSLFLVATSAMLALASPLRKRAMETETDWVTQYITVTVTDDGTDAPPTPVLVPSTTSSTTSSIITTTTTSTTTTTTTTTPVRSPTGLVFFEAPQQTSSSSANKAPPTPSQAPLSTSIEPVEYPQTTTSKAEPPKASPSALSPPSSNLGDYENTMLEQHNLIRQNHSAPALEWDPVLAQYAANTANTCVFKHDMNQGTGHYGQNLASAGSSANIDNLKIQSAAQAVVNQWYNGEAANYDAFYGMENPPSNVPLGNYGHFTQVVWKATTKVGCSTVKCPAGTVLSLPSWYTVCDYTQAGNVGGEYGANVLRPKGMKMIVV